MATAGQIACPAAHADPRPGHAVSVPILLPVLAILVACQAAPIGWRTLIAVAIIALLGVPHGALDGELARPVLRPMLGRAWLPAFALPYLALSAGVMLAWHAAPILTLAAFLAASVWHFGQEDAGPEALASIARGGLPVAIPVLLHPTATAHFLGTISFTAMPALSPWLRGAAALWCGIAVLWLLQAAARRDWPALADAALVAALFTALPPLPAFTAYFVALHAPRHMQALAAGGQAPRVRSMRQAVLRSMPLTAATFLIAAALWPFLPGAAPQRALALTVQLLAALTLPHMLLPAVLNWCRGPIAAHA